MTYFDQFKEDPQVECLELCLNTPNSYISVKDLCDYLMSSEILIESISKTLSKQYNIQFDIIGLDVLALEKGSIRIPLLIRKLSKNQTVAAATGATIGIIGQIIVALMLNTPQIEINNNNYYENPIIIENQVLLDNKKTVKSLRAITDLTISNADMRDISITYQKGNGEIATEVISKSQLIDNQEALEEALFKYDQKYTELIVLSTRIHGYPFIKCKYKGRIIIALVEEADIRDYHLKQGDIIMADLGVVKQENSVQYVIRRIYDVIPSM